VRMFRERTRYRTLGEQDATEQLTRAV